MSTTSPPTPPPSCTTPQPPTPAARADDSLGSTVTRPYGSSNNSSINRSDDGRNSPSQETNKPPLLYEDSYGESSHNARASSWPSPPPPSLIATTPPQTPQTSNNAADNDDFFARNKLSKLDKLMCDDIAQSLLAAQGYERSSPPRYAWQGWCSYSVLLTQTKNDTTDRNGSGKRATDILLQFRPPRHAVDSKVLALARAVYGDERVPRLVYAADVLLWPRAVPPARELFFSSAAKGREGRREEVMAMDRLCVTATTLLPGVPYAVVQPGRSGWRRGRGAGERGRGKKAVLTREELGWQREVVRGFAGFVARGWRGGGGADGVVHGFEEHASSQQTPVSVSSLMKASGGGSSLCDRIPAKLAQLCEQLPTLALRERAEGVRKNNPRLPMLPLTLNHGDLVPGNILVDRATGQLTGVVDWAEAEVGWWGLPLYGVEFLLGFVESRRHRRSPGREEKNDMEEEAGDAGDTPGVAWGAEAKGGGGGGTSGGSEGTTRAFEWTYYAQAEELRGLFWEEVEREIGGVFGELEVRRAVEVVRDVGVLLWFGFAWDDGKVDRVVDEVDDPREVLLLETFLGVGAYGGIAEWEKARL
ncbi:Protein kinase-like [Lasiodiplodia theobromae]|uniref:Protein kinase-like n=1 Tax=Lasiodiplodia theobromae TaxID=45133 RepID=UPI0015C3A811|nr:Protein kinase-like [Lasiodiplodia theobromae]KAF4545418.1 Protein kinase-like [Lasiodiplodia theobromae]